MTDVQPGPPVSPPTPPAPQSAPQPAVAARALAAHLLLHDGPIVPEPLGVLMALGGIGLALVGAWQVLLMYVVACGVAIAAAAAVTRRPR